MKHIEIYTDGACSGQPRPGRLGRDPAVPHGAEGCTRRSFPAAWPNTTNNRMEMTALLEALRQLKEPCAIDLYSDSKYVIDSLQKGWARVACPRLEESRQIPRPEPGSVGPAAGRGEKHEITYHWLKGHAGHPKTNAVTAWLWSKVRNMAGVRPDLALGKETWTVLTHLKSRIRSCWD